MPQKAQKKKRAAHDPVKERLNKHIALIAGLFVLAIFAVQPLMMTNYYYNITYTKLATFVTLLCAAFGCAACALIYAMANGYKFEIKFKGLVRKLRPYEWALLAYWLALLISAVASVEQKSVWMGTSFRSEGFWMQTSYLLAIAFVGRCYKFKERDLLVLCAVASVVATYAIFQYFGADFLDLNPWDQKGNYGPQLTFLSTMSNRNMFAPYLAMAFLVSAVMFSQMKKKLHWAYLPCAAITFFTLMINDTDSAYVGILAAITVGFPFVARDKKSIGRVLFVGSGMAFLAWLYDFLFSIMGDFGESHMSVFAKYLPWLALALAAAGACVYFVEIKKWPVIKPTTWRIVWACLLVVIIVGGYAALPAIAERSGHRLLLEASRVSRGELSDEMGSGRGYIWTRAFQLFLERPVFGHGPDTFSPVFFDRYGVEQGVRFDKVHNEYLQILVDEGIVGLICILGVYVLILWQARKHLNSTVALALTVTMFCVVVQAFFNFSTPITHPVIYTVWGILAGLTAKSEETVGT